MNKSKDKKSRQDELKKYNSAIKKGLTNGIRFTQLVDKVQTTTDHQALLTAVNQLTRYHLNTKWVRFPYQFKVADYYLIFMDRLLTQHGNGASVHIINKHQKLFQRLQVLDTFDSFYFDPSSDDHDRGMYYKDSRYHEALFYLNLDQKKLRFNSHALTTAFLVHYLQKMDAKQIKAVVKILIKFGQELRKDYGFQVDFSILDANDQKFYQFKHSPLPHDLIDKLFITSAEHKYMLKSYMNYGAQLCLRDNLRINIYATDHNGSEWGVEVRDSHNQLSWFDIILGYDFLRSWYLQNLQQLILS